MVTIVLLMPKAHKATEFQKNIYFCFIDYGKAFDCVDHNKLWKILKEMGIPDHLTCLSWQTLFWGPPKSLQMVIAAMK